MKAILGAGAVRHVRLFGFCGEARDRPEARLTFGLARFGDDRANLDTREICEEDVDAWNLLVWRQRKLEIPA